MLILRSPASSLGCPIHYIALIMLQEGYATKYNVGDGATDGQDVDDKPADPMEGLDGLDEAGPQPQ